MAGGVINHMFTGFGGEVAGEGGRFDGRKERAGMATNSKIEWTDATWNPVVGCTRVSAGCDHCYAVRQSFRNGEMGHAKYKGLTVLNPRGGRHFNGTVRTVEEALTIPLRRKKPTTYFVNSMSDLFHRDVPFDFIDKVFAVMALTRQHTYQVLTKRPGRMAEYLANVEWPMQRAEQVYLDYYVQMRESGPCAAAQQRQWLKNWGKECGSTGWPLPNVWLGTSVENQKAADERIPHLLRCPAAVRFLSCEPLLGPVSLRWVAAFDGMATKPWPSSTDELDGLREIQWVIVGGESGAGARPMHVDWARRLRDQCAAAGVPFFFKQWGAWELADFDNDEAEWVAQDGERRPYTSRRPPGAGAWALMENVGKKAAGRVLDGRTWDEFPQTTVVA